jgi:segregation and condensation protein B
MKRKNKKAMLEAALFMSSDPLSMRRLVKILRTDIGRIETMIQDLQARLEQEDHGVKLVNTLEGYQLKVKGPYVNAVRGLARFQDLKRGLLKVLAIIAYKQPVTQSDIVKIIGNRTYSYVRTLVNKGLVKAIKTGRTRALVLTKEFADYFGLESVEDAKLLFDGLDLKEVKKIEEEVDDEPINKINDNANTKTEDDVNADKKNEQS